MTNRLALLSTFIITTLTLAGCTKEQSEAPAVAPSEMPKQQIDVAEVLATQLTDWKQFTTRLDTQNDIDIKPRVSGVVSRVHVTDGASVKVGELLFKLDEKVFRAEVKRLTGLRDAAEAAMQQAEQERKRFEKLRAQKAVSAEQADARKFEALQRKAELTSAQGELDRALLDLRYTDIKSPIEGKVSTSLVKRGDTVIAGNSVLANVVSVDKVDAYFEVDERTWNIEFGDITAEDKLPVFLQLSGEEGFQHEGVLDFIDSRINASSGTLRVKASFVADDPKLRPGAFGRVRMAAEGAKDRHVIFERAIGTDLNNRFVLVVDENDMLQYRPIILGEQVGALRVVTSGLNAGERFAANGPARVFPGMPIAPNMIELALEPSTTQEAQ